MACRVPCLPATARAVAWFKTGTSIRARCCVDQLNEALLGRRQAAVMPSLSGERRRCRRCRVAVNSQPHLALTGRRPVGVAVSLAGERCRCCRRRSQQQHAVPRGRRLVGELPGFAGGRRRFHCSRARAPACLLSAALTGGVMQCCLVDGRLA
jgi:hypothetical protein